MIPAFWYVSSNFGDALAPWLVERIAGKRCVYVPQVEPAPKFLVTGSILGEAKNEHCICWGVGFGSMTDSCHVYADIRAVRGPISQARALICGAKCPPVYGDPAVLLPRLYTPPTPARRYRLGIVPHFVDHAQAYGVYETSPDVLVVDILKPIEQVIDAITSCDAVVSSSLHGLIVAVAYGIRNRWIRFGPGVSGDGMKFHDFHLSVGIAPYAPLDGASVAPPVDALIAACQPTAPPSPAMLDALWAACPFRA